MLKYLHPVCLDNRSLYVTKAIVFKAKRCTDLLKNLSDFYQVQRAAYCRCYQNIV